MNLHLRKKAWDDYRKSCAHANSDATTPGFFRTPGPPSFPEPTHEDLEREADWDLTPITSRKKEVDATYES